MILLNIVNLYNNNIGSSDIPEYVSLAFHSLAILLVNEVLHNFFQKFLIHSEFLISPFLGYFKKVVKGAVHVMVMGVFKCLNRDAFHFVFPLLLNLFLVFIKGLNLFIEAFLEILRKSQDIAFEDSYRLRNRTLTCFFAFFLFNKIVFSVDFKLISLQDLANIGCSRFDLLGG